LPINPQVAYSSYLQYYAPYHDIPLQSHATESIVNTVGTITFETWFSLYIFLLACSQAFFFFF
jgi:hypothetical protein